MKTVAPPPDGARVLETANPPGSYPSGILIEPVHGGIYVLVLGNGVDGLAFSGL